MQYPISTILKEKHKIKLMQEALIFRKVLLFYTLLQLTEEEKKKVSNTKNLRP